MVYYMELSKADNSKTKQARVVFLVQELWPGHGLLYGTKSKADNSKTKQARVVFLVPCFNVMHAPVKFNKYILYGLGVMAQTRIGTYLRKGQTG